MAESSGQFIDVDLLSAEADSEHESEEDSLVSSHEMTSPKAGSESLQSDTSSDVSLLDRLRSPTPSDLSRKRQVRQKAPPKGMKRGKGREKGDPRNVSPTERVRAYPDEQFTVSNNKLFCSACREELASKKSSIESHVRSQKHTNGKKRLALRSKRESDILQALKTYDSQIHPVGDSVP